MEANIANSISSLSVLFGVAVFHLGAAVPEIANALNLDVPEKTLKDARKRNRKLIFSVILLSSLPNFLMLSTILFVMSPNLILHIRAYEFNFSDFNFLVTLFQIIGAIVLFYAILSFSNLIRLGIKWYAMW